MSQEREIEAKRLERCYKELAEVLAQTYGVTPPTVEFSWKIYTDFGPGASYLFKKHKILVTYDTKPHEFAHEFKHYLQDVVEGIDFEEEILKAWKAGIISPPMMRLQYDRLLIEKEAHKFDKEYRKLIEEEGKKIYGSGVWVSKLLREKFRQGEIPEFVLTVFRERV